MRRLLLLAVLGLLPLAAQGQRSMGFHGSAPARVSPGVTARPATPARVSPSTRFASRPMPATRLVAPRTGVFISSRRTFFPSRFGSRNFHHFHHRPLFFNSCFNGFFDPFCGNPFLASSFGFPLFDPFFADSFNAPPAQPQPVVVEQDNNSRELALQVQELTDAIQAMRDEERNRDQARNNASSRPAAQEPDTILVFRDGRQITTRNYAIAGGTIWLLSENSARKIQLSELDPAATEQANAKNGVDFHLPATPEQH